MKSLKKDLQNALNDNLIFSCNQSPTLSAKLKAIGDKWCTIEVVANPATYMSELNDEVADKIGTLIIQPVVNIHNAIYF